MGRRERILAYRFAYGGAAHRHFDNAEPGRLELLRFPHEDGRSFLP